MHISEVDGIGILDESIKNKNMTKYNFTSVEMILSPDGVHAQEGLPCLIQAYVILMWIYNQLSIPKSVYGNRLFVNDGNYNVLNVPGANLGNAIVVGTDNQNTIAQNVAIKSFKEGLKLVLDNLTQ